MKKRISKPLLSVAAIGVFLILAIASSEKTRPKIEHSKLEMAIAAIEEYPEVVDAGVTQKGKTLSLVIVVRRGTSKTRAHELGDNFVRLVKTFNGYETNPGKEIGEGIYDYLIGVYDTNQNKIDSGAKVSFSSKITW